MNLKSSFFYLLPILLFLPNTSLAATTNETEIIANLSPQLAQKPDYQAHKQRILQTIVNTLIEQDKWEQALDIIETEEIDGYEAEHLRRFIAIRAAIKGKFSFAELLANSLEDKSARNSALLQVVINLAEAGNTERALQIIQSLPEGLSDKSRALEAVARELAAQGKVEQALEVARTIESEEHKAVALSLAGEVEEALQLAATLKEVDQTRTLGSMARALARVGEFDQAIKLAKSLPRSTFQGEVLYNIVTSLVEAEQWEQALQVTKLMQDDYRRENRFVKLPSEVFITNARSLALVKIATGLKEKGQLDRALEVAQSIDGSGRKIVAKDYKESALREIAVAFVRAGQLNKALGITQTTENSYDDGQVAIELSKLGKFDQALEIARDLENEFALVNIAIELAKIGKLEEAEEIAQSLKNEVHQREIFVGIAQLLVKDGKVQEALQLTPQVPPSQKHFIIGAIAEELVLVNFNYGVELFQTLEEEEYKSAVARRMAVGLVTKNQVHRALQLAELVTIPYYDPLLGKLLGEMAVNFVKLGDFDRALAIAKSSPQALNTFELRELAIELAIAGQIEQVKELVDNQENALGWIAIGLSRKGELNQALEIIAGLENEEVKAQAIKLITLGLIEAGNFTQAMEVTQSFVEANELNYDRATVLASIAKALVRAKQLDLASQVAEILNSSISENNAVGLAHLHSLALWSIANSHIEVGNVDEGLKIAASLNRGMKMWVFQNAVNALVKSGNTNGALELARSLEAEGHDSIMHHIAIAVAREGNFEEALELTSSLEESKQSATIRGIAYTLVEQGKTDKALELINSLADVPNSDWERIAVKLAEQGEVEKALDIVQSLPKVSQEIALTEIAVKLSSLGKIDKAIEIAQSLSKYKQDETLAYIAVDMAVQGDIKRAQEMMLSLHEEHASTLRIAVSKLLEKEKFTLAEQLAPSIPNNTAYAQVLNSLATHYIEVGDKGKAKELLNQAFAVIN